jgi:DNA primase
MPIPEQLIDQVLQGTDIVEVISRYVQLKKTGRSYKACCPFHHEKTPSFVVSHDKQIYHCFGCGAGGNAFSFLMKHENMQFPEAFEMLASAAGIKVPKDARRSGQDALSDKLFAVNEEACRFYQSALAASRAAQDYIASRGIGAEAVKTFRIGYAPDSWEAMIGALKARSVGVEMLEKAGLAISNERGGHYDRFRNRIVFPITDLRNRVLGFGARVMDASLPKYINSPETPVYSKGRNLYGLSASKDAIKKAGHALIVEGYLDFLIPYQAGVQNIIATLGTALTVDQIKLIKRFAATVVTVYDPDEAGETASLRSLDLFLGEGVNVYISELPAGYDPDSFIRKFGADEFRKLIKSAKNIFDYKFEKLTKRHNAGTTHGKASIVGEMLPTIARIQNAVSRSELVKKLAERLSVDVEAVKAELGKVRPDQAARPVPITPVEVSSGAAKAEMVILAVLLAGADFVERATHALDLNDLKSSAIRDIVLKIYELHRNNKEVRAAALMGLFGASPESAALISEAASMLDMLADKDKALEDCVARIKRDNVKERLAALQQAIALAHKNKDESGIIKLVAEYNGLVKISKAR